MLDTERDVHLGGGVRGWGRGGHVAVETSNSEHAAAGHEPTDVSLGPVRKRRYERTKKTVPGDMGEVTLATPRDRLGPFYVASGVNLAGRKGLLGLWLSEKT